MNSKFFLILFVALTPIYGHCMDGLRVRPCSIPRDVPSLKYLSAGVLLSPQYKVWRKSPEYVAWQKNEEGMPRDCVI